MSQGGKTDESKKLFQDSQVRNNHDNHRNDHRGIFRLLCQAGTANRKRVGRVGYIFRIPVYRLDHAEGKNMNAVKKEFPDIVAGRWHIRNSRGSVAVFEIRRSCAGREYEKRISPYYTDPDEALIFLSELPLAQEDRQRLCTVSERFRTLTRISQIKASPNKRHMQILRAIDHYRKHDTGIDSGLIMKHLGYTDPNKVRLRITELQQAGLIKRTGKHKDVHSGVKVWTYGLTADGKEKI